MFKGMSEIQLLQAHFPLSLSASRLGIDKEHESLLTVLIAQVSSLKWGGPHTASMVAGE